MLVEDAIQVAFDAVKKYFGGKDHRLEEVEVGNAGEFEITISFRADDVGMSRPMTFGSEGVGASVYGQRKAAIGIDPTRTYKDVIINPDGAIKAIRMRQIVVG